MEEIEHVVISEEEDQAEKQMKEELRQVIMKLKSNKSPRHNGICVEVMLNRI